MSILIDRSSRVVVHGLTGREGSFHGAAMLEYGTRVVAGMTPGKGGQTALNGRVPVFDTVADAVRETGADTSCIFVPAPGAPDEHIGAEAQHQGRGGPAAERHRRVAEGVAVEVKGRPDAESEPAIAAASPLGTGKPMAPKRSVSASAG